MGYGMGYGVCTGSYGVCTGGGPGYVRGMYGSVRVRVRGMYGVCTGMYGFGSVVRSVVRTGSTPYQART